MIDLNILDDATIWVAISFVLFVILVFKPIKSQISNNLDKKISELKAKIDEAKKLKEEAESLYKEQENNFCLLYTSPSPRDKRQSRMPSSA